MYSFVHYAYVLLLPLAAAYLMMLAGVQKKALEWKRPRVCPSCNREPYRCRCRG